MLIASLISLSNAATLSMTVPAGEEVNRKIDLEKDDRIAIKFTAVGAENSLISFSIFYPNATEIRFGEVGVFDYSFTCDIEGEYLMSFVNNDINDNKLVTLNYDVEHYIFGMPQMLFLAIAITTICLAMLAIYVLLGQSP
jgi:hypothetical protein